MSVETALGAAYRAIAPNMRDLPIFNPALEVEVVGLRPHLGGVAAVVVTPWFMNIVFVPPASLPSPAAGERVVREFPVGALELLVGQLDGVGIVESRSLFSPMGQFVDRAQALAVANDAAKTLFGPPPEEPKAAPSTRRELFRRALRGD